MAWLAGYTTRKKLTIDNTKVDDTLTNFPVLVKLNAGNFTFADANSDGFDIRFTSSDGETLLKYERERHDDGNDLAEYWVKVPSISSSADTIIYVYFRTTDTGDGADGENVWDANFKMVQHLALNATDSTSNDSDGTLINTPTDVEGKIGRAYSFLASSREYVDLANPASLNYGAGSWTFNSWIKTGSSATQHIYNTGQSGGVQGINIWFEGSNDKLYVKVSDGTNLVQSLTTNDEWDDDAWHHYAVTYDGTAGTVTLYVDGNNEGTGTNVNVGDSDNADDIYIADRSVSTQQPFNGEIDEVRMSNKVREAEWLKAEWNSQNNTLLSIGDKQEQKTTTMSADIVLFKTQTTTMSADIIVVDRRTTTMSADIYPVDRKTTTMSADIHLIDRPTTTMSADIMLLKTQTTTMSADIILVDRRISALSADIYLVDRLTTTMSADIMLLKTQSTSMSADIMLLKTQTTPMSADIIVVDRRTTTMSADIYPVDRKTTTMSADLYLIDRTSTTLSADIILVRGLTIIINDKIYTDAISAYNIVREINNVTSCSFKILGDVSSADFNIGNYATFILYPSLRVIFRGTIRQRKFNHNGTELTLKCFDDLIKANDRMFVDGGSYIKKWAATDSDTIIAALAGVAGLEEGSIVASGTNYNFSLQNDTTLSGIKKNAEITGMDFYVSEESDGSDY